ncbi:Aste57867_18465 [Aphanomyces stellatus]|uniref:Aste57867_18465 protein n=1 Tax=Aphanomyces stellatus TaxID=120398 RepID=A0A485LAE3_9STRA|nr:hypothetical protein As57867_018403 [Aphanomyces stellatus]VFT95201.1 Aste57867_18465 [Aphanomyces stellatus]
MVQVASGAAVIYGLFAAFGFVLLHFSYKYARKYYTQAAFLLPPFVCICVIYENIILATVGLDKSYTSVKVMLVFQSCIIPAMLLVCFEIAYLVHKNRSVNFCGISFDSGHRTNRSDVKSNILRFAMWVVGLGLLTLKLLVYYRYFNVIVFTSGIYELDGSATVGTILTIIPAFSLVVLAIYIGMRLWNYGSNYAYTVHSTCFNPWIWMMVGSCLLAAGYLMPDPIFQTSSDGGEICMLAAIIRMFREVHKDLQEGADIGLHLEGTPMHDGAATSISPRQNYQVTDESPSSSASAAYDLVGTPKGGSAKKSAAMLDRHVEETRLTDASTDAYLSVVIARTKEKKNDGFVEIPLHESSSAKGVPMLQATTTAAGNRAAVMPWTGGGDDMPMMEMPKSAAVVRDVQEPMDLVKETDSISMRQDAGWTTTDEVEGEWETTKAPSVVAVEAQHDATWTAAWENVEAVSEVANKTDAGWQDEAWTVAAPATSTADEFVTREEAKEEVQEGIVEETREMEQVTVTMHDATIVDKDDVVLDDVTMDETTQAGPDERSTDPHPQSKVDTSPPVSQEAMLPIEHIEETDESEYEDTFVGGTEPGSPDDGSLTNEDDPKVDDEEEKAWLAASSTFEKVELPHDAAVEAVRNGEETIAEFTTEANDEEETTEAEAIKEVEPPAKSTSEANDAESATDDLFLKESWTKIGEEIKTRVDVSALEAPHHAEHLPDLAKEHDNDLLDMMFETAVKTDEADSKVDDK